LPVFFRVYSVVSCRFLKVRMGVGVTVGVGVGVGGVMAK